MGAVAQLVYSFASQVCQYPATGDPGIGYFRGIIDAECYVDTLLWRDKAGVVRGILNHYPIAIPPYEQAGNVNVMVDPAYQRQGIATALLNEALGRWAINLRQQRYTAAGRKLRQAGRERRRVMAHCYPVGSRVRLRNPQEDERLTDGRSMPCLICDHVASDSAQPMYLINIGILLDERYQFHVLEDELESAEKGT